MLQQLPAERPFELTQAAIDVFPWRLWLPTIGPIRDKVIGTGITRIALVETEEEDTRYKSWARFLIARADYTALLLNASHGQPPQ